MIYIARTFSSLAALNLYRGQTFNWIRIITVFAQAATGDSVDLKYLGRTKRHRGQQIPCLAFLATRRAVLNPDPALRFLPSSVIARWG